ncbi:MAG TPA: penicillin acylase family protein [Vicinamibacterales bacterium]|nr:penicillin acylase family protein [Vicinamibacterales bacterium]
MLRWILRGVVALIVLILVAAAAVTWRLWRALPDTDGTVAAAGVRERVEIIRDPEGVPHIRARHDTDGLFALGYVHAQDRLWQMEFQRRIAAGRLAEILGPTALETDRLMRTIGFARAAREGLDALSAEARALLDTYVAGVNACLARMPASKRPIEFAILRFAPAPWRAEDVLAWQKVMAWSMSMNWRYELLRARLVARLGDSGAEALLPASVSGGPLVLPDFLPAPRPPAAPNPTTSAGRRGDSVAPPGAGLHRAVPYEPSSGGSNNWVVAGSRTATGKPLLANDPHLGTQAPAVWYVAHVTAGPLDVIGATLPGAPVVVIGHNGRIAWGVTNMLADVQDLFVERINDRDEAQVDGRWEPMRVIHEMIGVRGAPPVPLRVRLTRHGPLLSDVFDESRPLALRWTGHDAGDRTAQAFLRVNRAGSWAEFAAAFDDYHAPMLNFVYADVAGNIGYVGPGALPIRRNDGRVPLDGASSSNDWVGYVPAVELPRSLNPQRGYIASANNQVVADTYPHIVSTSWEAPYRAARIAEVLEKTPRATLADMQRLQLDQQSAQVRRVLPFLLRATPRSVDARDALARLKQWDGRMTGESSGAALFEAFYRRAVWRLFADDLGPTLWADYRGYSSDVGKAFDAIARDVHSRWCDDANTAARESCEEALGQALELTLGDLRMANGTPNLDRWRWDRQNEVWFPHMPFQASAALRRFFSRRVSRGGNAFTVNPSMPLRDQLLVPSYRQIVDLSNFDASVFILPLGQSGQLWSAHYDDLLTDWNEGRYRPLRFSRAAVDAAVRHRLTLEPARAAALPRQ